MKTSTVQLLPGLKVYKRSFKLESAVYLFLLVWHSWYLGRDTTTDAALLVLKTCTITNCFVVYRKPMEEDFMISIK